MPGLLPPGGVRNRRSAGERGAPAERDSRRQPVLATASKLEGLCPKVAKFYESRKFGVTARVPKEESPAVGKKICVDKRWITLTKQVVAFPDGNTIWSFEEAAPGPSDETGFSGQKVPDYTSILERIASSLEALAEHFFAQTEEASVQEVLEDETSPPEDATDDGHKPLSFFEKMSPRKRHNRIYQHIAWYYEVTRPDLDVNDAHPTTLRFLRVHANKENDFEYADCCSPSA